MSLTPTALLLLSVQRHHLEEHPQERLLAREWNVQIQRARDEGDLIVVVQWDGLPGTPGETFSKGWTLHPEFRTEAGDLRVRATLPDAFEGSGLAAELHARAVRDVFLLALPGALALEASAQAAQQAGFGVVMLETPVGLG